MNNFAESKSDLNKSGEKHAINTILCNHIV